MTRNTHRSLGTVPGRRGALILVAAAAGLTLGGPSTAFGGAEFEAIILDAAPPIVGVSFAGVVNGAGQLVYHTGEADPALRKLVHVEVGATDYSWSTLEDPTRSFGSSNMDINESGVVAFRWGDGKNWGVSRWSPDTGETLIASYEGTGNGFPAIADDGTVVWGEGNLAFRWNADGAPEQIGSNPDPLCPVWGDGFYSSPGGRIAHSYGLGFLCTGGIGVVSWDDPLSPPEFSGPLWALCSQKYVLGITETGKVLVYSVPSCAVVQLYDLETGELEEVPLSDISAQINNDEWVVAADGSLSRDGSTEDLIDLVSGVTNIYTVLAIGDNGHFLVVSDIDGNRVPVLIRPSSGPVEGDVTGDGVVDLTDLLAILTAWGPCEGCPEDLDGDGAVNFTDLLLVLGNWS